MEMKRPMDVIGDCRSFHLIGIGGVGMGAIARVLLEMGKRVAGSDTHPGPHTEKLARRGATIYSGHNGENVGEVDLVVATDAVKESNPEIAEARRRGIPVLFRPDMLAALAAGRRCVAVAGTHGKTSTSAMLAWILERTGKDPTVILGADVLSYDGGGKLGSDDIIVIEACEAFNAMLKLAPQIGVITSIEPDHLDYHGSFENLLASFARFAENVACDGGLLIYNADDEGASRVGRASSGRRTTYGCGDDAGVAITGVSPTREGSTFTFRTESYGEVTARIGVPGLHAVSNAAGAIAAAMALGVEPSDAAWALQRYEAPRRRFEVRGVFDGVTLIDDYAHHPTEIAAALAAARQRHPGSRIVALFQPHMYSRTKFLMSEFARCFGDADEVVVTEVYAAREPMKGLPSAPGEMADVAQELTEALAREEPNKPVCFIEDKARAADAAWAHACEGDVVIVIGAGDIGDEADRLAGGRGSRRAAP
jgi:UDP-N-acetylmuramate--alanine ligase